MFNDCEQKKCLALTTIVHTQNSHGGREEMTYVMPQTTCVNNFNYNALFAPGVGTSQQYYVKHVDTHRTYTKHTLAEEQNIIHL